MSTELELGTLIVVVLKARNLNDKHSFYKQDAFAQISLNGTAHRTPVDVKGGQHPVWDAEIRVPVMKDPKGKNRILEVSCWSRESKTDDVLGEGKVDISETLKTGEFDDWVPLITASGVNRGDIYLEMTFYAHGPPKASLAVPAKTNLDRRPSKLNPSERLWRPPPSTPPKLSRSSSPSHSPGPSGFKNHNNYLGPPSNSLPRPRSSSSSPSRQNDHLLPPNPDAGPPAIPSTLLPGLGARKQPQSSPSSSSSPPTQRQDYPISPAPNETPPANTANPYLVPPSPGILPSTLRPGNQHTSIAFSQHPTHYPSRSTPSPNPYTDTGYLPLTSPYQSQNTLPLPSDHKQFQPQPLAYEQHSTPISFPLPQVPVASAYDYRNSSSSHYSAPTGPPRNDTRNDSPLPDPFLHARYASPLPLPQGNYSPRSHRPSESELDFSRKQALLRAEEEAARRKRQEDQDMELARQLDRELNLG